VNDAKDGKRKVLSSQKKSPPRKISSRAQKKHKKRRKIGGGGGRGDKKEVGNAQKWGSRTGTNTKGCFCLRPDHARKEIGGDEKCAGLSGAKARGKKRYAGVLDQKRVKWSRTGKSGSLEKG